MVSSQQASGSLLSRVYAGAWRSEPGQLDISLAEFPDLLGSLLHDGGAGLLWPRMAHRDAEYGAIAEILERTYQQYADNLERIESQIGTLSSLMAAADIAAVLVKGWAISSRYGLPQIRRPGDIDLIVPTETYEHAQEIVRDAIEQGVTTSVDLYSDDAWCSKGNCPSVEFRQHLQLLECDGVQVPVLSPADALRHVCLHAIHHLQDFLATTLPIWLCDIGVLIENPTHEIDWDRVLGTEDHQRQSVSIAIALARDLVGVDANLLPPELQSFQLPTWAAEAVLERWAEPIWSVEHEVSQRGITGALRRLWPSKLNAALACNVPLDRQFYLPYQVWTFTHRMTWYLGYELPRNVIAKQRLANDRSDKDSRV